MLNYIVTGPRTDRPPLLIAHGLFGSARNWGVIAKRLSDTRRVIAVDMRNHGASPWKARHGYDDQATDLAAVIEANGGRADVVGHSMGGKAAMMLALRHPQAVSRLVVADIAPVAYCHSQMPMIEAMRAVNLDLVTKRSDAEAQMAALVPDVSVRAFLLQSLDIKAKRWRLNLDVLAAEMGRIMGWPGGDSENALPVLFLAGGDSDYVTADSRAYSKRLFPAARFAKIPGAGHWLHAAKPRQFEAALRVFLGA